MTARLLTPSWPSRALGRDKRVNVLLPEGYTDSGPRYPVLYLLHGYGAGRDTWLRRTRLLDALRGTRLIVVLPESGRRWLINDHAGLRYEDYVIHDLVPAVDEHFPTLADRSARAIGGFSMGGATALFLALRHRGLFAAVASYAGAFEAPRRTGDPYAAHRGDPAFVMPTVESHERVWGPPGSATRRRYDPYLLIDAASPGPFPAVHLDVGTEDHDRMVRMSRSVREALDRRGWPVEYHERRGGHDWEYVDAALPASLEFLSRRLAGAAAGDAVPRP
ncbi:alpha/beta hydrolase [Streptomyces naphthomycinicus]|uniref:alpha/beta hydrolase n=1 Tax=Streptomyces naphthomycinicus TaxID=2872625 RepID=UPI001CED2395|nr:alpha/beta hydrolase family protein [Streptomyces sp. TML10]